MATIWATGSQPNGGNTVFRFAGNRVMTKSATQPTAFDSVLSPSTNRDLLTGAKLIVISLVTKDTT